MLVDSTVGTVVARAVVAVGVGALSAVSADALSTAPLAFVCEFGAVSPPDPDEQAPSAQVSTMATDVVVTLRRRCMPGDCRSARARHVDSAGHHRAGVGVVRVCDVTHAHAELVDRPDVGRVFTTSRRVRIGDCSPGGRVRLDACTRFLQDIANDDSREAGSHNPTAWVARRTVIRIDRFPAYLDMVTLATWCSGLGPRWAERRYEMIVKPIASDGEAGPAAGRIEAATLWVHVELETMKPASVPPGFAEQFAVAARGRTVTARLHLPTRPPAATEETAWPLRFADFDVLGHVNNSVYWAMVEERLAARRDLRAPLTITLEHHTGIDPGDEVTLRTAEHDRGFDLWVTVGDGRVAAVVSATG